MEDIHLSVRNTSRGVMPAPQNESLDLSAEDRAVLFEVIEPTLLIRSQEQFFKWTQTELQRIFPHGKLVCGLGSLNKNGVEVKHIMCFNFPKEYVETLQRSRGLVRSPILAKWMQERQPILFEPDDIEASHFNDPVWSENFRRFGLLNLAAHGQRDVDSQTASYFSFSCIPGRLSVRHALLLRLLVPHLHIMLTRIAPNLLVSKPKPASRKLNITQREKEILAWLRNGKTNWEIAQVLGISESTVKKHVRRILANLNVCSRTQAVAKAIDLKLIRTK